MLSGQYLFGFMQMILELELQEELYLDTAVKPADNLG